MEDNVITVPDVSTVNLNQVYYDSGQYILVMLLYNPHNIKFQSVS